jgi:hypothetical protein
MSRSTCGGRGLGPAAAGWRPRAGSVSDWRGILALAPGVERGACSVAAYAGVAVAPFATMNA